jgi:hemerythrin-like domain-containing protein
MPGPLERLRLDHQNFQRLLQLMTHELDQVEALEREDIELMQEIMHYITRYSDQVHHPTEDLIYERMATRSPECRESLAGVPRDHASLAEEGVAFAETLRNAVEGALVLRDELLAQGRHYVDHLTEHMTLEERHLFPMAAQVLEESDLTEVDGILEEKRDPVFGDVVEQDFRNLYDHIQHS